MIERRVDVAEGSGNAFYLNQIILLLSYSLHDMVHTRLAILPIMQRVLVLGLEVNEVGGIMTRRMGRKERERGYSRLPNSICCGRQEGEVHCRELHPRMILGNG